MLLMYQATPANTAPREVRNAKQNKKAPMATGSTTRTSMGRVQSLVGKIFTFIKGHCAHQPPTIGNATPRMEQSTSSHRCSFIGDGACAFCCFLFSCCCVIIIVFLFLEVTSIPATTGFRFYIARAYHGLLSKIPPFLTLSSQILRSHCFPNWSLHYALSTIKQQIWDKYRLLRHI